MSTMGVYIYIYQLCLLNLTILLYSTIVVLIVVLIMELAKANPKFIAKCSFKYKMVIIINFFYLIFFSVKKAV